MEILSLLRTAVSVGCSDLHLCVDRPPMMRLFGNIQPLDASLPALNAEEVKRLIYTALTDAQKARIERQLDLDCSFSVQGLGRFRLNVLYTFLGLEAVIRIISEKIPDPEAIGLTPAMKALAKLPRGLVLVTGPTGAGKSTTLASLIEEVNRTRNDHIVTIEDPIEFVYTPKRCIIRQREVGQHTQSFTAALRASLREDPDVILVGEMRDIETIALALTAAETGHLCFATLHTRDAASTISRIVDVFPPHQQNQIRVQLAASLRAVIAQVLLPRKDGKGRFAAREFMVASAPVANHIRENKPHLLPAAIETGQQYGMVQMDRSLGEAVKAGILDPDLALTNAQNPDVMLQFAGLRRRP
jgi:twitching motility protein PilT